MEKFLREWRQDAVNKHQYDSAIFIGDKCLALTGPPGDPNDAFFLAQIHFSTGHYTRAQTFLSASGLIKKSAPCRYLYALSLIKQGKHEEALGALGENNPKPNHRRRGQARSNDEKYEAAMCYLRGQVYAKQNAFDKAKDCYKEAVRIDVKCFEAFDQLMRNNLMTPDEEWSFLGELDFDVISSSIGGANGEAAAQFVKMLYTTRLSKYKNTNQFNEAIENLSTHYPLGSNPDILLAKAEMLFTQCHFKECLALTEKLLEGDKYNFNAYPLYLACLHELQDVNKIFLVAHDLADHHPDEPCAWLAVGVYYLVIGRIAEARRFFSKSSMMNPHFGAAWIGFAHTFAQEGEHDQAISAYSTAARLFQGTHLPQLFLGMQHLQLNNITLADEYLQTAYQLCKTDPLLLNELGVVFYHNDHLHEAIKLFQRALKLAEDIQAAPKSWISTRANLGHAYRRLGRYRDAYREFLEVLKHGGADANVRCALGLVCLLDNRHWESVTHLHEALAISPSDPVATELLESALERGSATTFEPTFMLPDGEIDAPSADDVDDMIDRKSRLRYGPGGPRREYEPATPDVDMRGSSSKPQGSTGRRSHLGDVSGRYVNQDDDGSMMEVSDEDM